mgnify:CR=1 FL=1|jgi:hypothetical protein
MFYLFFVFTAVKCEVVLMWRSLVMKETKFFGSLVFITSLPSACTMPAGDPRDVKNKAYLKFTRKTVLNDKTGTGSYANA